MSTIRIVIADDIKETRENIRKLLSFEEDIEIVGEARNGEEAVSIVKELKPDVILMDINMPIKDGIRATEEISLQVPETTVIMISVQGDNEYLRKAMAAGARDFVEKPFTGEDLLQAIMKVHSLEEKRKEVSNIPRKRGKVITVFSTKGGVGKTTIATNLAASMSKLSKKKVALVDLDLQFGDIAIMLNVSLRSTISDLIKDVNQIESSTIEDYMVTHFTGVKVLAAPVKPEYAEYITASHVSKIINSLRARFDYIIIDTSNGLNETVLSALDLADKILFVSTLDLPTIKNIKSGLDVMESLHYPNAKINVVLNKASEQFGIKYKDFEETLKLPIWAYVPDDSQTVITSINKGFPFVIMRTETKVAKSIIGMAKDLSEEEEEKPVEKAGFWKFRSST